ncbi:MAG: hypothetical protein N2321_01585 [Melioribacteraceae bacterium]|nr:hypothetical protein [Melioribacteraceae bacterium]
MPKEFYIIRLFGQFQILFNLAIYFIISIPLSSQQHVFKTYNRANGLPSDYIMCTYQDRAGYLWFGTDRGAARYNGKSFLILNASNGLGNNFVLKIFQDRNGSMWFGLHESGVTKYDGKNFYTYNSKNSPLGNSVKNILEDKFGCIYFDVENGIVLLFQEKFSLLKLHNQHRLLSVLQDGTILIEDSLSYKRIIPTDDLEFKTTTVNVPKEVKKIFKPHFGPLGAFVRSNGNVCLFGMTGFIELKNVEGKNPIAVRKLYNISIESVTEDKEGRLWCGTESNGILCFEKDSYQFVKCIVKKTSKIELVLHFVITKVIYGSVLWEAVFKNFLGHI